MWCAGCQTDVAGEFSSDGQTLRCATCGGEVSSVKSPSLHPKTREIRELLERWSAEELLDPDFTHGQDSASASLGLSGEAPAEHDSEDSEAVDGAPAEPIAAAGAPLRTPRRDRRPKFRLDASHNPKAGSAAPVPAPHAREVSKSSHQTRRDGLHATLPEPHFNIASAFDGKKNPGYGESLVGQLLAYGGIAVLTVGTALVLWGYFGGPENYTPMGWLLATVGQMLLFLGVVTLVSGGMEQTTHEVSRRIQVLGDQLIRIERHAQEHALSGPHFKTGEEQGEPQRQSAGSARHHAADG